MTSDPQNKSARTFQCRDYLWDTFDQLAQEMDCTPDSLVNEAMRLYVQSRGRGGPMADIPEPLEPRAGGGFRAQMPNMPGRPPGPPQNPQMPGRPPMGGPMNAPPMQPGGRPAMPTMGGPGTPGAPARLPPLTAPPTGLPPMAPRPPGPPGGMPGMPPMMTPAGRPMQPQMQQQQQMQQPQMQHQPQHQPQMQQQQHQPQMQQQHQPQMQQHQPQQQQMQRPQAPQGMPGAPRPGAPMGRSGGTLVAIYEGQQYPVTKEEFVIGRGQKTSDLTIRDSNVSRRHACIVLYGGQYWIVDQQSTNGVEFNGTKVDKKVVEHGDVVRICDHEIQFVYR